jgi:glucokinase
MPGWVVGIDLGGTKVDFGLVNPQDQIVARRRIATEAQAGVQSVVERLTQNILELEKELPPEERVAAVGICTPGPVDYEAGMLLDPPNLPALHNTPLRQLLADRLQIPVSLEHDAKASALGELYYGAGRGARSMVYVIVGTGVGAAFILNGQVYHGLHNLAGEFGHMTMDRHGELCACGSRGCVETYICGPWLARRYRHAVEMEGWTTSGHHDLLALTGAQVADLAKQGEPLAVHIMTAAGQALGLAIASLAMILNIDLYVIGGSVAKAGDVLLEPARKIMPHYSYQSVSRTVRIVATTLDTDGPILGGSWLARQALNSRRK